MTMQSAKQRTKQTISEKILSEKAGRLVFAGEVVVCEADLVIGADASTPMAIDYFTRMGGTQLFDATRVMFAFDHYAPATTSSTRAFHDVMRRFVEQYGGSLHEEGEGISFQLAAELGRALPSDLVIGADSHTVTCGALNLFATGIGSSDLAAAMITGQLWLRVPESIKVILHGERADGVSAKDIALALVALIGTDGANYQTLEFHGPALAHLSLEDRLVICNLGVEMDAKAAIFPFDDATEAYLNARGIGARGPSNTRDRRNNNADDDAIGNTRSLFAPVSADAGDSRDSNAGDDTIGSARSRFGAVSADEGAHYSREVTLDVSAITPRVALPHSPGNVTSLDAVIGTPIHMAFIGTCTGGRVPDFHEALRILERFGGQVAAGVQLVLTPASRAVDEALRADGTMQKFEAMGATVTTVGCGACCGTSGVIPGNHTTVISTANRNFKARMGNASAFIYLASPAACAAAAATGRITDPRSVSSTAKL